MLYTVTVGTQTFQIGKTGDVPLVHIFYFYTLVVYLNTGFSQSSVFLQWVFLAVFTVQTPM